MLSAMVMQNFFYLVCAIAMCHGCFPAVQKESDLRIFYVPDFFAMTAAASMLLLCHQYGLALAGMNPGRPCAECYLMTISVKTFYVSFISAS